MIGFRAYRTQTQISRKSSILKSFGTWSVMFIFLGGGFSHWALAQSLSKALPAKKTLNMQEKISLLKERQSETPDDLSIKIELAREFIKIGKEQEVIDLLKPHIGEIGKEDTLILAQAYRQKKNTIKNSKYWGCY